MTVKILDEFKKFILRGNVVDLSTGVRFWPSPVQRKPSLSRKGGRSTRPTA
jgi:hypothetical protein